MKRQKLSKPAIRRLWLFAVIFLAFAAIGLYRFASIKLRPFMLINAASTGNFAEARQALSLGVSPNIIDLDAFPINALAGRHVMGGHGETVLMVAVESRHVCVARLLLDAGADPDRGDGAMPPLMAAVGNGDIPCIRLLLQHGADPNGHYKDNTPVLDSVPYIPNTNTPNPEIVMILKRAGAKGDY